MYRDTVWTKHCVGVYGVVPIFRGVPIYGDTPIYGDVRVPVSPNIGTPLNWKDVPIVVLISWTDDVIELQNQKHDQKYDIIVLV